MIISIANQKGGVGKTTIAINLSAALSMADLRVLIIDADSQSHSTVGLGVQAEKGKTLYDALCNRIDVEEAIYKTQIENLFVIASDENLSAFDVEFSEMDRTIIKNKILPLREKFDFIFIDCPPSLSVITINSLVASDSLIIPVVAEFFALEGFAKIIRTYEIVKEELNPSLEILGIVVNSFDKRTRLGREILDEFYKFFPDKIFKTIIPKNVKIAESQSHGLPVVLYDPKSPGADAFSKLAEEILEITKKIEEKTKIINEKKGEEKRKEEGEKFY